MTDINLDLLTLTEVTAETVREVLRLSVADKQKHFVASNAISISQAYFSDTAWFRAISYDGTFVGFVMLDLNIKDEDYYLWRYMIDEKHQGKGFGKRALELVVDFVKKQPGAKAFYTSCVPGEGSPSKFYEKFGFVATGEIDEGEHVYKLTLGE
ncbi:GNAT family N-acetyltransferase [Acidaminobacter sp. JC074]|uniref:GNAT family N-acetyltransferase n=1 Tax=Acidaminobacter sp. JC074 TaxID=2530199 RepID=UPI001F0FB991|nr:GNAT family N-acetyltransferase [Acidaminobacter sp. JC074]MCH4887874.1 GNAT family N-acetyltransferase [Acidaminobacter sp. JC074]